ERTFPQDHELVRRLHIDRIGLRLYAFGHLYDWHLRRPSEQIRQSTGVTRIEMLQNDESHPILRWQMMEKFHRCFESAGGATNPDNRTRHCFLARTWSFAIAIFPRCRRSRILAFDGTRALRHQHNIAAMRFRYKNRLWAIGRLALRSNSGERRLPGED